MKTLLQTLEPIHFILFAFIFLVFLASALLRAPGVRGWIGEAKVRLALWLFLNNGTYRVYNNVLLPTEDGTAQIDHIVLSPFGIFAIETKNMSGAIYGTARDATWTQKIGNQTHKFQNPLRQNEKHVRTLAVCLGIPREQIRSVIAFAGSARLMKVAPGVTQGAGCVRAIRSFRQPLLDPGRVGELCAALEMNQLQATRKNMSQHIARVRDIQARKSAGPPACPKCSQPMILRTARRGATSGSQFWGCPRYPACRGTRPSAKDVP